jgi:transposase-like protein
MSWPNEELARRLDLHRTTQAKWKNKYTDETLEALTKIMSKTSPDCSGQQEPTLKGDQP